MESFDPPLHPGRAPRWSIVREESPEEDAPVRFAVLHDERRVAWGLRDKDAAARWLRRLSAPVQSQIAL